MKLILVTRVLLHWLTPCLKLCECWNWKPSVARFFSDHGLAALAARLPVALTSLRLNAMDCGRLGDAGLGALARGLLTLNSLENLSLNLWWCRCVSNAGVAVLADALPRTLCSLDLNLEGCESVSDVGITALTFGLPRCLCTLTLTLACCKGVTDRSVDALAAHLPSDLQKLIINVQRTSVSQEAQRTCELLECLRCWVPSNDELVIPEVPTKQIAKPAEPNDGVREFVLLATKRAAEPAGPSATVSELVQLAPEIASEADPCVRNDTLAMDMRTGPATTRNKPVHASTRGCASKDAPAFLAPAPPLPAGPAPAEPSRIRPPGAAQPQLPVSRSLPPVTRSPRSLPPVMHSPRFPLNAAASASPVSGMRRGLAPIALSRLNEPAAAIAITELPRRYRYYVPPLAVGLPRLER